MPIEALQSSTEGIHNLRSSTEGIHNLRIFLQINFHKYLS